MSYKKWVEESGIKVGPGGMYCPCCNPYNEHPRKSKKKIKRAARRKIKQDLKKDY